jgi:kynurenine 3-monooxygenase
MAEYTRLRKPAGDAILDLALQNYIEMRDLTGDPVFLQQKKLEARLQQKHPDRWLPLYSQVTFSHTPYHEALARGRQQQKAMEAVMSAPEKWNEFHDDRWMDAVLKELETLDAEG